MGKQSQNKSGLHKPQTRLQKNSGVKIENGIQYVKVDKDDHQHQDGAGGSGLQGASVVSSGGVDVLHPLVVSEQEKHHGATGPDHEGKKHGIRDGPQEDSGCTGT